MPELKSPANLISQAMAPPRMSAPLQEGAMKEAQPRKSGCESPGTTPVAASGVARIFIELKDRPGEAKRYAGRYTELVQGIANALKNRKIKPHEDERFITEVWSTMNGNLNIGKNEFDFLSKSLDGGGWDCDNSAFLVFDVARELKVPLEMVVVPNHVFVVTENFFFETTVGRYFPIQKLPQHYPIIYLKTSDIEKIHSISFLSRGNAYSEKRDYDSAIRDYSEAIRLNPKNGDVYNIRGIAYAGKGDYDSAVRDCSEAIRLNPEDAYAYNSRGSIYYEKGDYDHAIKDYSKAICLNPKLVADVYHNRGLAYDNKGDPDSAIKDFTEAIRLNPEDAQMYVIRGLAYSKKGDRARAEEDFSRAAQLRQASGQ